MLRLLTHPRMTLDPARAASMPAAMVWTLHDALTVLEENERLAAERD